MSKIEELEARIAALSAEVAALKPQPDKIDWTDPAWVGRTVEVRDYDHELWLRSILCSYRPELNRSFILHSGLGWEQCRPYTGPTRPNWIEWRGGECPVDSNALVIAQLYNGEFRLCEAADCFWEHAPRDLSIMRYSVVVP